MWKTALGINGFGSSNIYYKKNITLDQIIRLGEELHFDGIELFPNPEPYPTTREKIDKAIKFWKSLSIKPFSLQGGSQEGIPGHPDGKIRKKYIDDLKFQIEFAYELGAEFVGVWSNLPIEGVSNEDSVKFCIDSYNEILEFAQDSGLYLAAEPEPVLIFNSQEVMEMVVNEINSPDFTIIYDFSHANILSEGNPIEFMNAFRGKIGHVHMTDNDGTCRIINGNQESSTHLPCGEGNLDLEGILRNLKKIGYDRWIQIDTWQDVDPFHGTKAGKKFLDQLPLW